MYFNKYHLDYFSKNNHSLLSLSIFFASFSILYLIGGGPVTNDELKYLSISIDTTPEPRVLNRYFHIYLQKLFIYIVNDPFIGMKLFWAFTISLTTALIFHSSMILTGSKQVIIGIISLLFFITQPLIFRFVGVTYTDYTVMLLLTLSFAIYISTDFSSFKNKCRLSLILGLLCIFSIKSKETGIISFVFLFGLILENISLSHGIRLISYWMIGIILGMTFMMGLDLLIINDFFFSLRISSIESLLSFNSGERERILGSWYSLILETDLIFLFIFYVISIPYLISQNKSDHIKILYLLPIAIIIFLTFTIAFGRLRVIPRYLIPIIPILCILASNYFNLAGTIKFKKITYSKKKLISLLVMTLFVFLVFSFCLRHASNLLTFNGWTARLFISNIYYPIILSLFILIFIFIKTDSYKFKLSIISLLFTSLIPMLIAIPNNLLFSNKVFNDRIYPLKAFNDYLSINNQSILIFSYDAYQGEYEASRGALIPFYFNVNIGCSVEGNQEPILCANEAIMEDYTLSQNIPDNIFDYAIVTSEFYDNKLKSYYPINSNNVIVDKSGKYILVCGNNACKNNSHIYLD